MDRVNDDPRLTQLSTQWTLVFQSHVGSPEQIAAAQATLMDRYSGAVHRYLVEALRDQDAAEDLAQEFALRFLRGDFHRADPECGRFRDFVKRALRNLMIDHWRRKKKRPRTAGDDLPEAASPAEHPDFDRRFLAGWRAELMSRAWKSLAQLQEQTGQPYHTVLHLRVEHPELHSPELAERLSERLGRAINAGALRMALKRSRDRFVEFLLEDVAAGLTEPTAEQVEQELIHLNLLGYCKDSVKREGYVPSRARLSDKA
jgi:RNA polymerase sigma-70 factor (ECF subfamily)